MTGIKDIAKLANVSVSTVSNVINNKKNVGAKTRENVLRICSEQNYHIITNGDNPRNDRLNTIVFNFSDFDRGFYLKIIKGISDYLTESGYDLIICTSKSSVNFMKRNFTSGAIILDSNMSDQTLQAIASRGFPIVVMDRFLPDKFIKSVVANNYPIMCEMIQTLVDRGYKKFGFIGGLESTLDNKERFGALTDTLMKNGIIFDKEIYFSGDYREKSGYQGAKILLLGNILPEVLVCANDNMAIGAARAFREQGIRVPEDVAITGFDDCTQAEQIGLTTVAIPRYESGYLAAKELLRMIAGTAVKEPFKLNASIKWRTSTK